MRTFLEFSPDSFINVCDEGEVRDPTSNPRFLLSINFFRAASHVEHMQILPSARTHILLTIVEESLDTSLNIDECADEVGVDMLDMLL